MRVTVRLFALATSAALVCLAASAAPAAVNFTPSFSTSTLSNQAGKSSPFALTVSRSDQDQNLGQISVQAPPGVLGMLRSVTPCPAAATEAGTCSTASQIGHISLSAGAGPDPVSLPPPGRSEDPVYLTGPYNGAPFGLAILLHGEAGPPSLDQAVVRATISIDRRTTQLTFATDPLPSVLQSTEFDLRSLTLTLNRPQFMRNPTSCQPLASSATILSTQGTAASLTSPFQATNCAALPFDPSFSVSTSAKTSRVDGASLYVKIIDRHGDAVAGSVKADLPRQLPTRLSTLNKACPYATFEANPAGCDPDARVGFARMGTQVLASDMSGPAYFVSYGGAQFPELVVVLQAEGVRIDLHATTFINPAGITSSTFAAIPDVPLRFFEITLPSGPDSALAANGNLCESKLRMPNAFVGENGAVIHRATPIKVSGCPKAKKSERRH